MRTILKVTSNNGKKMGLPFEINQLAVQIVTASNIYDSAALISEAIEYLNEA